MNNKDITAVITSFEFSITMILRSLPKDFIQFSIFFSLLNEVMIAVISLLYIYNVIN